MTEELVKGFYTGSVEEEWERLTQDAYHRLEFDTTMHFLEKYLPQNARVLDAGGGPGRYTVELAKQGYEVILLDMVPANLEFAEKQIKIAKVQNKVEQIVEGSIVDLSRFEDKAFDAVLCLGGPLSHVLEEEHREKAISELLRVAKEDAPIVVSVMSRLSVLIVVLTMGPHEFEESFFRPMRDTGDYPGHSGFTARHFFLPEELENAFRNQGAKVLEMVGLEGLGSHHAEKVNELAKNKKRWPSGWGLISKRAPIQQWSASMSICCLSVKNSSLCLNLAALHPKGLCEFFVMRTVDPAVIASYTFAVRVSSIWHRKQSAW